MHKPSSFAHRHNSDGSYDSICSRCYATVASAGNERALSRSESAHVCDPMALYLAHQGSIPERIPMLLGGVAWSSSRGADESSPTCNQKFPRLTKLRLTVRLDRAD